ncbi:MAG TPA: hypothetical protein VNT99_11035 [Methylomirabilota bacterium]|nr:hypothetical protein [Methylomirabilota bacterium]
MRIILLLCLTLLIGCASSAKKMNSLSIGMTKAEAIRVMGTPKSTSASQGVEYLIYILDASRTDALLPEEYYVRIVAGKVDAYGQMRDLPSGEAPK